MRVKFSLLALLALSFFAFSACEDEEDPNHIMALLEDDAELSSLVAALEEAGLNTALEAEDGTFTVFAPTNTALANLPAGVDLAQVLQYHVLTSTVMAADLFDADSLANPATLEGERIWIDARETPPAINGTNLFTLALAATSPHGHADIVATDIEADNGVIHKINNVLLPDEYLNVLEVATKRWDLSSVSGALGLTGAGTLTALSNPQANLTVFAPNNATLDAVAAGGVSLTSDPQLLLNVLNTHVVAGAQAYTTSDLVTAGQLTPLNTNPAATLFFAAQGGSFLVQTAFMQQAHTASPLINEFAQISAAPDQNIVCSNGIIHVLNGLLLPEAPPAPAAKL